MSTYRALACAVCAGALVFLAFAAPAMAGFAEGEKAFQAGAYGDAATEWGIAANAGNTEAQFRFGQLLEQGLGLPQSYVRAHAWYNLASAAGHAGARAARDQLTRVMTNEQLAQAQDMAARWQPSRRAEAPIYDPRDVAEIPEDSGYTVRHVLRQSLWR